MVATTATLSAEDVERMPEDTRGEVIRGEMLPVCPIGIEHGGIAGNLITALRLWVKPRRLGVVGGQIGFVLERDPLVLLAPDAAFIRADRLPPRPQNQEFFRGAPDLAVEVVSTSESSRETHDQVLLYLEAGTPLVWVVQPRRQTVTVYAQDRSARILSIGDMLDGGDVLPGFTLPVADVFAW